MFVCHPLTRVEKGVYSLCTRSGLGGLAMAKDQVRLGARKLSIWPKGQETRPRGSPRIHSTHFTDTDHYHPRLIEWLHAIEGKPQATEYFFRGACGTKVRNIHQWPLPEARLLQARAEELFRRVTGCRTAVTDSSWANLYQPRDYCMPHSHLRSTASIVYLLDPGDPDPEDPHAGQFCIVDPRVASCCQEDEDCMTTPFTPELNPGTMLIFPSQIVHCVNPYNGTRPRISLAWNLNDRKIAGPHDWEMP